LTRRIKRIRGLKVTEISSVDAAACPGARIVLRKRDDDTGLVTIIRKADGQSWTLPADSAVLPGLRENAQRLGFEVLSEETPKMTNGSRKAMVAVAKQFASTGQMPVEIQKRDVYAAIVKGAAKAQQPGQSDAQAFAAYVETAEGTSLYRMYKAADGPDWSGPVAPVFTSVHARQQWEREEHVRKADVTRLGRERQMQLLIESISRGFWVSGKYASPEAARAAAETSPPVKALRSRLSIYRDSRAA
jgi:hypothetical protein